jgi:hypothetical protein
LADLSGQFGVKNSATKEKFGPLVIFTFLTAFVLFERKKILVFVYGKRKRFPGLTYFYRYCNKRKNAKLSKVWPPCWPFPYKTAKICPQICPAFYHRAQIPSPLPLRVAKTGRNHLNEEFIPLLPIGIGERF